MELSKREDFAGKSAHIIGMARSGLAAVEVLTSLGSTVTVHDRKQASELPDAIAICRKSGASIMVGDDAYKRITDADFIVISPGVPITNEALVLAKEAGIPILPEIELAYRLSIAPIAAVTGTNGKTTTTALIGAMIQASGRKTYIAGNIIAGDIRLPLVKAAAEASSDDIIAAEISSFQLEMISSFRSKVGALLNISSDHLDRHPDIETYAAMKARLFEFQRADDFAVLNADNQAVMMFTPSIRSQIILFSRLKELAEGVFIRGSKVIYRSNGFEQVLCDTSSMKLRGSHNIENVLAASAVCMALGIEPDAIQSALDEFNPPEHRLEPVAEINGVEFLNNSMCTNVDASIRSLEAIGRPAIVIAGGKDKGSDYTELGKAFVKYAKFVALIGADAGLIEEASRAAGYTNIEKTASLREAVDAAWNHAEPGDTIVLSPGCASFDMFKDFEDRGRQFKSIVLSLASQMGVEDGS
ncbi:MAG: UDP-N-acetylmuramoyl-L-alanine--D-glutamate ligase [Armatimonadota bacterium]